MRTVAIIQARMGSTRLPGKVLAEAAGKPLLIHMVERLARCETLDEIVVAIPGTSENDPIVDVMLPIMDAWEGVSLFPSTAPEEDVLARVLEAAHWSNLDHGVTEGPLTVELTADCPPIDPRIVDEVVEACDPSHPMPVHFASSSRDVVGEEYAYPRGMDVRVFPLSVLEQVAKLTDDPRDREHVSLYIWEHPEQFVIQPVYAPKQLRDDIRLTVDTPEDLELVRTIFEELYPADKEFGLGHILKLLKLAPELREINADVKQKEVR